MLFEEIPSLKNFFDTEELRSCLSKATGYYIDDIVISQHSDFHVNTLGGWHNDIDGKITVHMRKQLRQKFSNLVFLNLKKSI